MGEGSRPERRQGKRKGFEIFDRQCTFYKISNRKKCTSTFRCPPLRSFHPDSTLLGSLHFSFFLLPFHTDVSQFELACTWKSLHGQFILDGRRESPVGRVYARVHAEQDEERKCEQFHGQPLSLSLSLLGGCSRSKRVKGRCCTTPSLPLPWNALTQSKRLPTHVHRARTRVKHVAPRELPATIKSAVAYHLLRRQPFSPTPFLPSLPRKQRDRERKRGGEKESWGGFVSWEFRSTIVLMIIRECMFICNGSKRKLLLVYAQFRGFGAN